MEQLDPRKRLILRAVVLEYVAMAEPVGSEHIAQKYELGVRSATIRNELSEIAELGFLEQPHASAGRVPSDQGYRYYVDHLIEPRHPGSAVRGQLKASLDEGEALGALLRETTKLLSRLTQLLSAASTINDSKVQVRHAVISALGPDRALLVLVLANGHVGNRLLECPEGLTLQELGIANERLLRTVEGRTLGQIARLKATDLAGGPGDKILGRALAGVKAMARELTRGILITHGEEYLFAQPEFRRDPTLPEGLIRSLEEEDAFHGALAIQGPHMLQITIGKENRPESLQAFTVMRQAFRVGEEEAGTIALIGPTRMDYEGSVALLEYAAHAVGATLTRLLGKGG
jgi:heat-inducible transcriptional repressor